MSSSTRIECFTWSPLKNIRKLCSVAVRGVRDEITFLYQNKLILMEFHGNVALGLTEPPSSDLMGPNWRLVR